MCGRWSFSSCGLDTRYPGDIIRPLCSPYANLKFLTYRLVVAGFFTVYLVIHLCTNVVKIEGLKIFIYLSDWTLILTTMYLVVAFLNGLTNFVYRLEYDYNGYNDPPALYRLQWLLFNVCIVISILISVSYWPTSGAHLPSSKIVESFLIHGLPAIVLLIDLFVMAVPVNFAHVIYPLAYGALYVCFAVIYWAVGGSDPFGRHYIYGILDFEQPKLVGRVIALEAMGTVGCQGLLCVITVFRDKLATQCQCAGRRVEPEEWLLTERNVTPTAAYS